MQAARPDPPDPIARAGAIAIAATRVGLGIGISTFTRPALAALGFDRPDATAIVLARLAGGRDIALGIHGLTARNDASRLAESSALATAVDAGDGVAFALALSAGDGIDRKALVNLPLIAGAVVTGGWITKRLRSA